ncbi:MAG: 5'-nucleotidase C-terminal domain-containing protein [Anaerolineae bacterium]|nr:5'-nucleotidase C-terminal domain-containing protein [Anaerolineae bacterium]
MGKTKYGPRTTQYASFLAAVLLMVCLLCAPRAVAQTGDYTLTLLHTSENHGAWEPWAPVANGPLIGGIARRATLVKQLRAQTPNLLLVDSGDISQRALLFTKYKGQEGRDLYNAVGYDAVALGNHEFDFGAKTLLDNFVTGAKFSILASNTDYSVEPGLNGKVQPYVVRDVGGQKIGLIGVMHEHLGTSVSPAWRVFSTDPVEAVRTSVKALEAQGVNKIVVLSHMGYSSRRSGLPFDDVGLAEAVNGVDVIVGGHDETLLADAASLPSYAPRPAGPNPSVVKSPNGAPVLIVNDWKWGGFLGRLDVTFNGQGVPTAWKGDNLLVDDKIAEEPSVAALYKGLSTAVDEVRKEVLGTVASDLPGERVDVRASEAALGNLIADAMLDVTAPDKTQVAMMNGGGIRVSLKAGQVTYGDVLTVLPFGNTIYTADLKGADLVKALENGVSGLDLSNPGASGGRFAQVSGVRFTADVTRPIGQRVLQVDIGTTQAGFKPLDPNAVYRVATNDFMINGGDGYEAFTRGAAIKQTDILLAEAVANYLRAQGTVNPKVEGRITLTRGSAPAPAAQATPATTGTAAIPTPSPATPTIALTPTLNPTALAAATQTAAVPLTLVATLTPTYATTVAATARLLNLTPTPPALPPTGDAGGWFVWVVGLGLALLLFGLLTRRVRV